MKKIVLIVLAVAGMTFTSDAQKFGHIDSQELLLAMPERDGAEKQITARATEYESELNAMKAEFDTKYQEYVDKGQTWPAAIRQQKERDLTQIQQNIQDFSLTIQNDLAALEEELLTPMIERAKTAIEEVGAEAGFTYIFDTSTGVTVYNGGEDVLPLVKKKLGL